MIKRNIYLLYAIAFLQGMVFYGPIATLYREARGVTILEITVIESISLALCLLLEIPWGILADRIGYRRTLVVCNGLYLLSKVVFWQAETVGAFLLERVLLSVALAGLSGVDTSVLYLSCGEERSQQVFGIYEGLQTAGLLLAAFVYSTSIGGDYDLAAELTVISYGAAAGFSLLLREVIPEEKDRSHGGKLLRDLLGVLRQPGTWLFLVGIALFNETHQVITVFLNQLQYARAGLPSEMMGYLYAAVTVAGGCGVFSARLTRGTGENQLLVSCCLAGAAACVLLAVTKRAWLSVLAILALRVVFSVLQPLRMAVQNRRIVAADRATALSIQTLLMDSVGIGTNVLFGALAEHSLPLAFAFGAGICGIGAGLLLLWSRKS